ncbi:putative membrane protein [Filibacter limicola]|uniref:Membrane protein n=1 Tax=Sporosarcina limicola TaxID=34101 RepID=A0A927MID2_9BACL|nr:sigma-Y antisigma factor component [Sporosarcina limicola]MBE1555215.1 putative membrane protein [Sporosarcina limicola]
MNSNELSSTPLWLLVVIAFILICQSSWMFWDAQKRGHNAWLWGFLGLIQFPMYLIIYLIFVRKIFKRKVSGSNS